MDHSQVRKQLAPRILPCLGVISTLVLFQLLSEFNVLPRVSFPPVSEILSELWLKFGQWTYWLAILQTLQGWAIGLGVTILLAIPAGIAVGSSEVLFRATRVIVEFLRPIPSVALVPLAIMVYGRGIETKVFLVTFAAFWPLFIQTIYGVRDVEPTTLDMARTFRVGPVARLWRVCVPGASPNIATGLRISSAVALVLTVTAELIVGIPGIGNEIQRSMSGGANTSMYAMIVTAGFIGWGLNYGIESIERRLLRWHPLFRSAT
jgi:ABC-type nitrate/sulfonate/bicarbonate transport system permease component